MTIDGDTLGHKLRLLRSSHGLTQVEFAKAIGAGRRSVTEWERDGRVPYLKQLRTISEIFGITIGELVPDTAEGVPAYWSEEVNSLHKSVSDLQNEVKVLHDTVSGGLSSNTAAIVAMRIDFIALQAAVKTEREKPAEKPVKNTGPFTMACMRGSR